ncbi:MAG: glycosyltransferase [Verrucomicrobiales bacterium]
MPGPAQPGDLPELVRTKYSNLESVDWWRNLQIDGLVLYAWGHPKFRHVARAVHEAGIRLVLNQDSGGWVSPRLGLRPWLGEQARLTGAGRVPGGRLHFIGQVAKGLSVGVLYTDRFRRRHFSYGDRIAAVSPVASERYQRLMECYGFRDSNRRVELLPHPVDPKFLYRGGKKERRLIAVGRWQDERQKRTRFLIEVLDRVLAKDTVLGVDLVGDPGANLIRWYSGLPLSLRGRIRLHGRVEPHVLVEMFEVSQVLYCSSAFESFHIASGEALCCGNSVVSSRSVSLASFEWFTGEGDGSLARHDQPGSHVAAILAELDRWQRGEHDASRISARWTTRLHAPQVAARVLAMFEEERGQAGEEAGNVRE